MNRIRKVNNKFQVLYTPNLIVTPYNKLLIGLWKDYDLKGFRIEEFDNIMDAQYQAFRMPDIDWYKLIRLNIDEYHQKCSYIKNELDKYNFNTHFEPHILTPQELKHITFERVLKFGSRFNPATHQNDIINITIVDPFSHNLLKICDLLKNNKVLNIRNKKIHSNKIIVLTGLTDLGLTYQITLVPSLIYRWVKSNKNIKHFDQKIDSYIVAQEQIDNLA
jgi:CRISPR/Cas system endoribonuclease Cas6 (RAMP superfamily)